MASKPKVLDLQATIGFEGRVRDGLVYHPNGKFVLYPLGATIVVKNIRTGHQDFLDGHTNAVSCLALSHDGKKLASGQVADSGFTAEVIIWDLDVAFNGDDAAVPGEVGALAKIHTLSLHMVSVVDVAFNCNDTQLATLGGDEDGNRLALWDVADGKAKQQSVTPGTKTLCWFHNNPDRFIAAGDHKDAFAVYDVHGSASRELQKLPVNTTGIKRHVTTVTIDADDKYALCGTASADLLVIYLKSQTLAQIKLFKQFNGKGITCLTMFQEGGDNMVLCGLGCGQVGLIKVESETGMPVLLKLTEFAGPVTSISIGFEYTGGLDTFVGTARGNQYIMNSTSLEWQLRLTAHHEPINDIVFPDNCSDIFVTASNEDIRVWLTETRLEMLRIRVPKLTCHCVTLTPDGGLILSGWGDGKIRAFLPQTGALAYTITEAHQNGVTSVCCFHTPNPDTGAYTVVTGGADGRVRVWSKVAMLYSLKEHKAAVTSVQVSKADNEIVSASADGSCIIWNAKSFTRRAAFFANTMFSAVQYHPDESQFLTTGSDRKITYWDADGNAIRLLDGSELEINSIHIEEKQGDFFVSGGNDKLVKVWNYDEGSLVAVGYGHSANITKSKVAPNGKFIVSVGREGGIFIWGLSDLKLSGGGSGGGGGGGGK
jgi:WD40 repeat protein